MRRTLIVPNRTAWAHERLAVARAGAHGLQILSLPQAVARLAGGFLEPVRTDTLLPLIAEALTKLELPELGAIGDLPGTSRAIARTLRKAWASKLNLAELADSSDRARDLAQVERFVLEHLPPAMRTPAQLAEGALARIDHAPSVLGPLSVRGVLDPEPCWREILTALAATVPVSWHLVAGAEVDLEWLARAGVAFVPASAHGPEESIAASADPRHEVVEALRWARALIASGRAQPGEIALAAAQTSEWDDDLQAAAAAGSLPVYFAGGRRALSTFPGQQAAALADLLVRGLTRSRALRVFRLCGSTSPALAALPSGWHRALPAEAILQRPEDWKRALDRAAGSGFVEDVDPRPAILPLVELAAEGIEQAPALGAALLSGIAAALWEQALQRAPAPALPTTLGELRVPDDGDPTASILWTGADDLVGSPRRFVRLLGMTSRGWPRVGGEDPILPDHILPARTLEPLPLAARDRRAFNCIRASTTGEIVYSFARRDRLGSEVGESPLLPRDIPRTALLRARTPEHAMSEADRLAARLAEFATHPRAASARACAMNWRDRSLTPHDGLLRPDHPAIARALERLHSATSLRRLLRDPLGFTWRYALGWREPEQIEVPLALDPKDFGNLVHEILERAVADLEREGGLAAANDDAIEAAISRATDAAAQAWVLERPLPPGTVWRRTLVEAADLAGAALRADATALVGQETWVEVPFGARDASPRDGLPWDAAAPVELPELGMRVGGRIDRLDLSADRRHARVTDYKTGRVPRDVGAWALNGGEELQRALYALAATRLLGEVAIESRLLYPREGGGIFALDDVSGTLETLTRYIGLARERLLAGFAVPAIDTGNSFDEFAIALPANARGLYLRRKDGAIREALQGLCELWELP